jgi:Flp pilus assembly protein TadG
MEFIRRAQRIINVSQLLAEVQFQFCGSFDEWGTLGMFRTVARYLRLNVSRFGAARDGATAVEFALIAPAFLAMLFAVIQSTLFLFAQATLQNAAVEAGRLFMTGQAQNAGTTQTQFHTNDVCPLVSALFNCANLQTDVSTYSSFSSANTSEPALYDAKGALITLGAYSPGSQGEIMVVQLAYPWPIFGIPLGSIFSNTGYGTTEIMGVSAFRVEPY